MLCASASMYPASSKYWLTKRVSGSRRHRSKARLVRSNTEPVVAEEYCGYSGSTNNRYDVLIKASD